ncbi:uncharacterized protein LOC143912339 [Arctopsyche grandis]|uniref:uncharacterized protein LOC143912339 n=1 Tax=Arctopsyche grandis TaxID=121162 RepID=UPI00406D7694
MTVTIVRDADMVEDTEMSKTVGLHLRQHVRPSKMSQTDSKRPLSEDLGRVINKQQPSIHKTVEAIGSILKIRRRASRCWFASICTMFATEHDVIAKLGMIVSRSQNTFKNAYVALRKTTLT